MIELNFESGDRVNAGQLLVVLNDTVEQASRQNEIASLELAELLYERDAKLVEQKSIPQSQYDRSRADLQRARAQLAETEARLAQKRITAPFSGRTGIRQIEIGDYVNVIAARDRKVRLTVWTDRKDPAGIRIGNYCLVCPGVRLSSATEIVVGDNVMFASGAYVTDSDWHDIYDRVAIVGKSAPVRIENNAWIGDSVIVCKGVTIGENSVIGAGSVVTSSIPANTIAAGNPARVIKPLDGDKKINTRAHWYANPAELFEEIDRIDKEKLGNNTFLDWMRYSLFPRRGD